MSSRPGRPTVAALLLLPYLAAPALALAPAASVRRPLSFLPRPSPSTLFATPSSDGAESSYDVAVLGSGPAGLSLAALLAADPSRPRVAVVSSAFDRRWIPNYGCWTEEWEALDAAYAARGVPGLSERGTDVRWSDTDCFFGEDGEEGNVPPEEGNYRRPLGRAYLRVSRDGLREAFAGEYDAVREDAVGTAAAPNVFLPAGAVTLEKGYTELTTAATGSSVRARVVVDATGAESSFTVRDDRDKEGYQIAYGAECKVEGSGVTPDRVGDYDRNKMTLFDYRSQAWREDVDPQNVIKAPTFNYVMPLSDDVVFFEETSLVANPAVSFRDCKRRLHARLAAMDVKITDVLEEEYCYIPMGGATPRPGQRLVPVGAAAGIVHPSTGFQLARALASNLDVAEQILEELRADPADFDADAAAARILGRTWTPQAQRQRAFAVFGGDFLMKQDVDGLRGFFSGFFRLEEGMWAGFLAGWKGLPNNQFHETWLARLWYGVVFLTKLPPAIALNMIGSIIAYTLQEGPELLQSVTPLFGEPKKYEDAVDFRKSVQGDVQAKAEAMSMIEEAKEGSNSKEEVAV